jgi:hypothetical protein
VAASSFSTAALIERSDQWLPVTSSPLSVFACINISELGCEESSLLMQI